MGTEDRESLSMVIWGLEEVGLQGQRGLSDGLSRLARYRDLHGP